MHALRPNPKTHIQEGWRILDFLSSKPESCHIVRLPLGNSQQTVCSAAIVHIKASKAVNLILNGGVLTVITYVST